MRLNAAAVRLFGENGYDATSIADIARVASMPVGGFYQHFRSKRQLLLSLMNQLLIGLSQINLQPGEHADARDIVRDLLERGFSEDLRYLGAYRAWQEAVLTDHNLARKQAQILNWTSARAAAAFRQLQRLPNARPRVNVDALARVLDSLFWHLLAQASHNRDVNLRRSVETTTHLIYHALFMDRL